VARHILDFDRKFCETGVRNGRTTLLVAFLDFMVGLVKNDKL
jgi:hypothetical protein